MSTQTTNIGLTKPDPNEYVSLDVENENKDIVDAEIGDLKTKADDLAGAGRTTETIKQNADDIADISAGMAELAKVHIATGTDAITITTDGSFSYIDGVWIKFKAQNSNTGAVTINIDSQGIKNLKNPDGTDLLAGDLMTGIVYEAYYSLGDDFFVLRSRGAKLDEIITTIENKGGTIVEPQKVVEIVNAINDVASWDADLVSQNIINGKNIFGVNGSLITRKIAWGNGSVNAVNGRINFNSGALSFRPRMVIAAIERTDQLPFHPDFDTSVMGPNRPNPFFRFDNFKDNWGTIIANDGNFTSDGSYLEMYDLSFSASVGQGYGSGSDYSNFTYRWIAIG